MGCLASATAIVLLSAREKAYHPQKLCRNCKWFNDKVKELREKGFYHVANVECPKTGDIVASGDSCRNIAWRIVVRPIKEGDQFELDCTKKVVVVGNVLIVAEPIFPFSPNREGASEIVQKAPRRGSPSGGEAREEDSQTA